MHKLLEMHKGRREYAQLVWSLFLSLFSAERLGWTTGYVGEATESHVHEVFCVDRVVATVLPQQFQQQQHAPDH